jgi:hypothetical protein
MRDFYFDDDTWKVRHFVVNTGSWLFGREVLVASDHFGELDPSRAVIDLDLTREQVGELPPLDVTNPLPSEDEREVRGAISDAPDPHRAAEHGPGNPHLRSASELMSGYTLHAPDGEIGRVDDLILDDEEWSVRYLIVHTGPWFLGKDALLPLFCIEQISYGEAEVFIDVSRATIKNAPPYNSGDAITAEYERLLQEHYSVSK